MVRYSITIEQTGESYLCSEEESLLCGMERLGKRGIPVGCRGGGCGVCKIEVTSGCFHARAMSRAHVNVDEEERGRVLACCVKPASNMVLRVIGKMKRSVCR